MGEEVVEAAAAELEVAVPVGVEAQLEGEQAVVLEVAQVLEVVQAVELQVGLKVGRAAP